MDRATMQKYIDVSLQHSEDLDAFGSCICAIMAAGAVKPKTRFSLAQGDEILNLNMLSGAKNSL